MAGLCGWLDTGVLTEQGAAVLDRMLGGLPAAGRVATLPQPGFACAGTERCIAVGNDGLVTVLIGQPYWSHAELAGLAARQGQAVALAEAYRHHDTGLLKYLHGAFTCAVFDPTAHRLLAAIDRIGQQSLYYAVPGGGIVIGSTADSVRAHPEVSSKLSAQGLFNYVFFHIVPSPGTIYEDQRKLPGAHYLDWQAGRLRVERYWLPTFTEETAAGPAELGEEMRALLQAAVRRASDRPELGAFLSGGLDSSTVAGLLAQQSPGGARTYSIGFAVPGYDEMDYARLTATHFHTRPHEYYLTTEDAVAAVPQLARFYDEPFGNSSALPSYYCAKRAHDDGVTRLLGGDGGDEIFAGNERYRKQQIFERYQRSPRFVRRFLIEGVLRAIPALRSLPLAGKAHSYVEQANIPLPDRLDTYNFLHRHTPTELFAPELLATVDTEYPRRWSREIYAAPDGASALNRMLYLDWHRTLHDNDLVKVNRACERAGVEVVYPLLDDPVVEFSCRVPSRWKIKHSQLRWFYKQAMQGFLAEGTLRKSKHGFGLPFGVWTLSHPELQELAYGSLRRLRNRGYFRPELLDRAVEWHRDTHAGYYGELIWILMMLEQWLQHHA